MQFSHFRPLHCHTWKGPMIKEKVDQRERKRADSLIYVNWCLLGTKEDAEKVSSLSLPAANTACAGRGHHNLTLCALFLSFSLSLPCFLPHRVWYSRLGDVSRLWRPCVLSYLLNAKTFLECFVSGVRDSTISLNVLFEAVCGCLLIAVWIETVLSYINVCNCLFEVCWRWSMLTLLCVFLNGVQ